MNVDLMLRIVLQCAPVIAGVKVSNLLIISRFESEGLFNYIEGTGISALCLYESSNKVIYLLYRENILRTYLMRTRVRHFLKRYGYCSGFNTMLSDLKKHFKKYYENNNDFPHEIGIFLGYPVADVEAFIENEGKGSILTGYWKVYYEPDQALEVFALYNQVRKDAANAVLNGYSLYEFVKTYQNGMALFNFSIDFSAHS